MRERTMIPNKSAKSTPSTMWIDCPAKNDASAAKCVVKNCEQSSTVIVYLASDPP